MKPTPTPKELMEALLRGYSIRFYRWPDYESVRLGQDGQLTGYVDECNLFMEGWEIIYPKGCVWTAWGIMDGRLELLGTADHLGEIVDKWPDAACTKLVEVEL